jgi:hypothetical protein
MDGGFFLVQEGQLELFEHRNKFTEIVGHERLFGGERGRKRPQWSVDLARRWLSNDQHEGEMSPGRRDAAGEPDPPRQTRSAAIRR